MKRLMKFLMSRVVIVGVLILLQLLFVLLAVMRFSEYIGVFFGLFTLVDLAVVCKIISTRENPSYKTAWIILVLSVPPFGVAMYFLFRGNQLSEKFKKILANIYSLMSFSSPDDSKAVLEAVDEPSAIRQAEYIARATNCPPYADTDVYYYPTGEDFLAALLCELEKAEKYIFMEYFIIEKGEMWNSIHDILLRKVSAGVDVRVVYDDLGCINHLSSRFHKELSAEGIKCRVFNRFIPILSARLNNRNHRKICVIDGKVGFTGGVNIADEYINVKHLYGYWKDNAVKLCGKAVHSLTVMFLSMWDSLDIKDLKRDPDYNSYIPEAYEPAKGGGIVQPYTDNPLDDSPVGETVYLNMIYSAKEYIYITTPYLIIDYTMERALCSAAESGIDVRIVVPGIPDKRIVNEATKSNYHRLIASGVRIYEYTPGFIHAKTFVADGKFAVVGTVNLDFRSLYLHFECGVWMYNAEVIKEIRADFDKIFTDSTEVSEEMLKVGVVKRIFRSVIELFSPLF